MKGKIQTALVALGIFLSTIFAHGQDAILKTPSVMAAINVLHSHTLSSFDKIEYSFVVRADGTPSKPQTSHDYFSNYLTIIPGSDKAIVHSHPMATSPQPSNGDFDAAKKLGGPNYEVSLYAIWVAEPNGRGHKVADIEMGKHGKIIVKFLDGTTLMAAAYPDDVRWYGPLRVFYGINPKTGREA